MSEHRVYPQKPYINAYICEITHNAWNIQITHGVQVGSSRDGRARLKYLAHPAQRDTLQPPDILPNGFSP